MLQSIGFSIEGMSLEEHLFKQIRFYDRTYEMKNGLIGTLVIFVTLGIISGFDIRELMLKFDLPPEFLYHVVNNLTPIKNNSDKRMFKLRNHSDEYKALTSVSIQTCKLLENCQF